MSTPADTIFPPEAPTRDRSPLRLRMTSDPRRGQLDGAWWPHTRDLAIELPDLVSHFPTGLGQIVRVLYSPPDWEPVPRRIPVDHGYIKAGSFPRDDTHLIHLKLADRHVFRVLVVPPHYSDGEGSEALLAATTRDYAHTATALLEAVRDSPDFNPGDRWNDDGGNWWGPHLVEPSFRTNA